MNDHILQNAWRLHQAGQFAEAAKLYNQVLSANPRHVGALQMLGFLHFQRGELGDADRIMERALKLNPTSVDALYNRGCVLQALGRHKDALSSFDRALALRPDYAPAMINRGNVLAQTGRFADALASYELALVLMPPTAELLLNRGNALFELGRHADALASYEQALAKDPQAAILWNNRGNAQVELGRGSDALASFGRAIALQANYADAYLNRGTALSKLERDSEALADFDKVLALDSGNIAALHGRGRSLRKLTRLAEALAAFEQILSAQPHDGDVAVDKGITLIALKRYDEALAAFATALAIAPDNVEALTNRASALLRLKRHEEARIDAARATAAEPKNAAAWHNLGSALSGLKRYKEALVCYDKALALAPDNATSWNNRGSAMLPLKEEEAALPFFEKALQLNPADADAWANRASAYSALRRYAQASTDSDRALALAPDLNFAARVGIHARLHACDWARREADKARVTADLRAGARVINVLDHRGLCDSEEECLLAARLWSAEEYPPQPHPLWRGERYAHDKIRLAYISTDLRTHAVGSLIVGCFEHHDKERFEMTAISLSAGDGSETRRRMEAAFDHFIDVQSMNDEAVAALLREREIDIAVDLNGYTGDARSGILAHRPAPVQVNYLGYPGTMGAPYIDYIIADPTVIPLAHRIHYSEQVVYLPYAYQANDRKRRIAQATPTREEAGLPRTGFVFACFNNTHKIGPEMFDIWMRLLRDVNDSVLWLFEDNAQAAQNLKREAAARGVDARRLVFAPRVMPPDHLARTRLADLFLDTLPYNAHTTASDALWMGLPVLTCPGQTFPSRVATSLLRAIGMDELVTSSLGEYETVARDLALDGHRLAAIKAKLLENRDTKPMFDTAQFTRYLESAYRGMWERQRTGLPPEGFAVPAETP
jgi:predicted O-linked N-acetylglucosamine transferase (SPINDLY family)